MDCFENVLFSAFFLVPAQILDAAAFDEADSVSMDVLDRLNRHVLVVRAAFLMLQCAHPDMV